jgi:outer membrane protein assembly factor BamB
VRYLGWQANVPQRVALAPDGARAAWASARGELVIEHLDGSAEIYGGPFDAPVTFMSFLGDDHVLLGSGRGTVHLVDATTGKEISSMAPPGPVARVEVDPRTGWLAGLRPGGGVWLVKVTPGEPMPTTTYAVADGANNFALLERPGPDAPLLFTVDAKLAVRRYTEAELVAGVSAKSIRERPSVTLPRAMTRFDRRGLGYAIETSRRLVIRDGATVKHTIELGFDIQDVAITDDGAHLIVMGHQTSIAEIDTDGTTKWTVSMGPGGRWAWSFSADGARLAVVGTGGGLVVDVASGERVASGCAWRFGATSSPPMARAVGVVPVCR